MLASNTNEDVEAHGLSSANTNEDAAADEVEVHGLTLNTNDDAEEDER